MSRYPEVTAAVGRAAIIVRPRYPGAVAVKLADGREVWAISRPDQIAMERQLCGDIRPGKVRSVLEAHLLHRKPFRTAARNVLRQHGISTPTEKHIESLTTAARRALRAARRRVGAMLTPGSTRT